MRARVEKVDVLVWNKSYVGGRERRTEDRREGGEEGRTQTKWEMVVELIRMAYQEEELVEEAAWKTVVPIPKGGGDYRGIGLVEVIWKAVAVIINRRFTAFITYHDYLYGFWAGCGTMTSTLEVKLLQKVATVREAVIHAIFLDLLKAYNALERSR